MGKCYGIEDVFNITMRLMKFISQEYSLSPYISISVGDCKILLTFTVDPVLDSIEIDMDHMKIHLRGTGLDIVEYIKDMYPNADIRRLREYSFSEHNVKDLLLECPKALETVNKYFSKAKEISQKYGTHFVEKIDSEGYMYPELTLNIKNHSIVELIEKIKYGLEIFWEYSGGRQLDTAFIESLDREDAIAEIRELLDIAATMIKAYVSRNRKVSRISISNRDKIRLWVSVSNINGAEDEIIIFEDIDGYTLEIVVGEEKRMELLKTGQYTYGETKEILTLKNKFNTLHELRRWLKEHPSQVP